MLTFKATISSEYTKPKDANFDIDGHFALSHKNSDVIEFVPLHKEVFEFSKTRILFTQSQKERFGDRLNADIIGLSCPLVDNTHYLLLTETVNDKTVYLIQFGDTRHKCKVTLHLDSINRFLLTIVHYNTLKYPAITWVDALKLIGWLIVTILLLTQTINSCNESNSKSTQPPSSTDTSNKKSQEKGGSLINTTDSFRIDTFRSFPYPNDTTKQKTQTK